MSPRGRAPRARAPRDEQDRAARGPPAHRAASAFAARRCPRSRRSRACGCARARAARTRRLRAPRRGGPLRRRARAVGAPEGTRIEVADLFAQRARAAQVPQDAVDRVGSRRRLARARRARAADASTSTSQRDDRPALAWPAVSRPARPHRGGARRARGRRRSSRVEHREGRVRSASGFVSRPDRHRPTSPGIHLFVNRRPVRDRVLQHALRRRLPRLCCRAVASRRPCCSSTCRPTPST